MSQKRTKDKRRLLLRWVIPAALIVVWFVVSAIGGPYFGKISSVATNDLSTFLPKSAESTKVNNQLGKFQGTDSIPAVIVFEKKDKLNHQDFAKLAGLSKAINKLRDVNGDVSLPVPSLDKQAAMIVVPIKTSASDKIDSVFNAINTEIHTAQISLKHKIGGPAAYTKDMVSAFSAIDVTLLLVALSVVFVILLIVYRSPFLPIIVLLTSMIALSGAIFVVWHLANSGAVQFNGQVQGILFILVIGAATDYSLLYLSRLREELVIHSSVLTATKKALAGSWEPIVAAGATVTVSLMCLLLSDLGSNRALGPVGGIGIVFAIFSALTFLPSALLLLGRTAFWPRRPMFDKTHHHESYQEQHRIWNRVGQLVSRSHNKLWLSISVVLLICCLGIFQLKANGVPQSDIVLGQSDARDAQVLIDNHFPSGSGSPADVITSQASFQQVADKLMTSKDVSAVSVVATGSPSGTIPLTSSNHAKTQPKTRVTATANPFTNARPKVVNGKVLLEVTLRYAADSDQAKALTPELRQLAHSADPQALVGGLSAVQYDVNQTSLRDRQVIIPVILIAITIILALLLRSIIAPIVLLLTTVISFGTTLGISALVFNHLFNFVGADPAVILFGFVFLVALGIDYNIFLMTRVREETAGLGVRAGTIKGLVVTGGVITSAGIVLASTFAALSIIPIMFLAQIAFMVAFGVLLDTIIVRSLLVPSLTLKIDRFMWWPSKLYRKK